MRRVGVGLIIPAVFTMVVAAWLAYLLITRGG
jgi:hypothetical protein